MGVRDPELDTPCTRLDEILGDYLAARERGSAPPAEQLLADHPELADDLRAFLADQDRLNRVMAPLLPRRAVALPQCGQILDGYELLEEIGRGGMGVVFKARQHGVGRLVALKMLGAGALATSADLQRFRLEATVIAELDHPHIVPLYEVGEWSPDGQSRLPYYSMKWVEGGSLTAHVASYRDRPADAVALVMSVARAVQHAHERGVLHRDLKPANILLAAGTAYVTDFGLAKRLTSTPDVRIQTASGTVLGTPSYMAPEQARDARHVTVAADVYALGAILYELLAGQPPFRAASYMETVLEVLEREPLPPSQHRRGVNRDLDTICLKCLQKEPARRYASAAALADDLERYLRHQPILARPAGAGERLLRWCRRQPVVAALSAAVLVSLVLGVVLVFLQWRRAEDSLEQARQEKRLAEERFRKTWEVVDRFCIRLSEEKLSQHPGLQPLRKELLEAGLADLQALLRSKGDEQGPRLDLADVHFSIGHINAGLGRPQDALAAFGRALADYRALSGRQPDDLVLALRVARTLGLIANQQHVRGDTRAAGVSLDEAHALLKSLPPTDPDVKTALTGVLNLRNALLGDSRRPREPTGAGPNVVAQRRELAAQFPDDPRRRLDLALALRNQALADFDLGKSEPAVQALQEARAIQEKESGAAPDNHDVKRDLAETLRYLGNYHIGRGQFQDGAALHATARRLLDEIVAANPATAGYRAILAALLSDVGSALGRQGQAAAALAEMERSLAIRKELVEKHPGVSAFEAALAQSYHNVGNLHLGAGRNAEAAQSYRAGSALYRVLMQKTPDNVLYPTQLAGSLNNLADALQKLKRDDEALAAFEEAVKLQRQALDKAPQSRSFRRDLSMMYRNLARAYRLKKRQEDSLRIMQEQRQLWPNEADELARLLRDFLLAAALTPPDHPGHRRGVERALETLTQALAKGYRDLDRLRNDPDLKLLRQRAEFEPLLRKHAPQ